MLVFLPPRGAPAALSAPDETRGTASGAAPAEDRSPLALSPRLSLGTPYRLFSGISLGQGLRFNNPYRLETELGSDARSLSATAPYASLSFGAAAGRSQFQHGAIVLGSFALAGVPQEVITPGYLLVFRPGPRFGARGRAGLAIVVEPDFNAGFELGLGGLFQLTAGVGVTLDLVGSLFYGAGTLESARTQIPIASLEVGVAYEYEVLP